MKDIIHKLIPNVVTFCTQLGATFVLFLLYRKFLHQPVIQWLEKRAAFQLEKIQAAKDLEAKAQEIHAEAKKHYEETVAYRQQMLNEAKQEALVVKNDILHEAKENANLQLDRAKSAIEVSKSEMLAEVKQEAIDIALKATEKILDKEINSETHQKALEDFLKEIDANE